MRDRRLDRLFLRYRSRGDVRALGEVFDATSEELLRVALNLVRDPVEADDLLQATFLTALERAESWDARRRLVPWLIGILVHDTHELRRARKRQVDPDRLELRESEGPQDAAERIEAGENLRRAIAGLPARYREVLQPFVERGQRAAEIAAQLGRPPGTVRMQIHRGLDLLRKALPPGLALGLLVTTAGHGLAAVREVVMREATRRAPLLAAGSAATGTALLGALTMSKKALLVTASLVAVSTLAWLAVDALAGPSEVDDLRRNTSSGAGRSDARLAGAGDPGLLVGAAGGAGAHSREVAELAAAGAANSTDYDANLAGISGRVLEADGAPAAHVAVELLELGMESLDRDPADAFLPPTERGAGWTVARTITAADGTFQLRGARPSALQGIGIDLGGARPWMRVMDAYLEPGGRTDLGDIVRPPVAPVTGKVVDGSGNPIEGVRVRGGGLNTDRFDWQHFAAADETTPVFVKQNDYLSVLVELPARSRGLMGYVPFTSTSTGPDGTFELPAAPANNLSLLLDHPDHGGALVEAGPGQANGRDLGDLPLAAGKPMTGRLVDVDGNGVAGAEVRGGRLVSLGWLIPDMAPLSAWATTDEQGEFVLRGIPESDDEIVLVARESEDYPWTIHKPGERTQALITLPTRHDVEVRVVDHEGAPIDAELVAYQPSVLGALEWGALLDPKVPRGVIERVDQGVYTLRDLQQANYTLQARADGYAIATERIRPRRNARAVTVELEPEVPLTVRVLDAESEAPVGRATVGLVADRSSTRLVARSETDAQGRARLRGVPQKTDDEAYLRVAHPRYGTRNVPLVQVAPGVLVVALEPGGGVRFRCRDAGQAPVAPVMLELDLPTDAPFANDYTKRFVLSNDAGDALAQSLPPGVWRWRAFERYLDNDVWQLMTRKVSASIIRQGTLTITAGEIAEVDVDVSGHLFETPLPLGSASLVGSVTRDGKVPTGHLTLKFMERASYESQTLNLGEDGTFSASALPAGRYELDLWIEDELATGWSAINLEFRRTFEIGEGERVRQEVVLETSTIRVKVFAADGKPKGAVEVRLASLDPGESLWDDGVTADSGEVVLAVNRPGAVRIEARHSVGGRASLEARIVGGVENGPFELHLERGVMISGTAKLDPKAIEVNAQAYHFLYTLHLTRVDDPRETQERYLKFEEDGRVTYELAGLGSGAWTAELRGCPYPLEIKPQEILVDDKDTQIDLVFEVKE